MKNTDATNNDYCDLLHSPFSEVFDYYGPLFHIPPTAVISVPHAGETTPEEFLPYLVDDQKALNDDVDYRVDKLIDIDQLRRMGVAVLIA
ncbi:MAG: hypothetical protein HQK53_12070 [Oligoflexia bacterium]|nr:hypothetical protein [Oligoflexia bacterium]